MRRQLLLLCVATQFLTRLPVPSPARFEPRWLGESTRYFPLVGALVGLLAAAIGVALARVLPNVVAVGGMLAASLLMTGALHEDGFADACDGLGGGTTRERALSIMHDSRIGAFGAIGLIMLLGLKWSILAALPGATMPLLLVGAHMWSRFCALGLVWRLPYARTGEETKSSPVAGALGGWDWVLSALLGTIAVGVIGLGGRSLGWTCPLGAMMAGAVLAAIVVLVWARYCHRRLGGYTGDCLGAAQQLAEIAFLASALALVQGPRASS